MVENQNSLFYYKHKQIYDYKTVNTNLVFECDRGCSLRVSIHII